MHCPAMQGIDGDYSRASRKRSGKGKNFMCFFVVADNKMVTYRKIVHSEHRQGVTNLLTPDESRRSLDLAIKACKTRSEIASKIGRGKGKNKMNTSIEIS
jgi:hypothetical protein